MKTTTEPNQALRISPEMERLLMTGPELAERLSLNQRTFYHMLANGRIGVVPLKFNSLTRFKLSEVAAWMAADCPNRERWLEMRGREELVKTFE
jgi:excisionase family DNA binding protein